MKDGQQTDFQQKYVFLQHQDSMALASSCSSWDLTQIDSNKGGEASHAPQLSEMRTVVRGAVSPTADKATVSALNQRSRVSFIAFLRDTIFSRHDFKSAMTGPASTTIAPKGRT